MSKSSASPEPEQRRSSSRVDLGFFDPQGVRNLNRTLSRMSTQQNADDERLESVTSGDTLFTDGPFDFERTLRILSKM